MKAVALNYTKRELREMDRPEPRLERDGQVLFRVREVGICGTDRDLASFRLSFPPPAGGFLVIGHECVGEVLQTATGVTTVKPGDVVVPLVRRPCDPPCRWCSQNRRDRCTGAYTERGISGAHGYFTELAVDAETDLVRIPPEIREHAVLIEPLSVVEKAIGNAFRLHPGQPETALILGAGTIGILTAMVLKARGLAVTVSSPELPASDRARLVEETGSAYRNRPEGPYDLIIEATGAVQAASDALEALGPSGVLVILGVTKSVEIPMLRLIVHNQAIAGSVNASPDDFHLAIGDLAQMPPRILNSMVEREPFSKFRSTLTGPLRSAPKTVHVIE